MSVQSRQALRLMKFVAEMRKNNFPNAGSFARLLRMADKEESIPCACSTRTIMRDIEILKSEYKAPIEYDATNRGYFLLNPSWELNVPLMNDDILSMSMLSTRLASDFLPEPVKARANSAMESTLAGNNSKFFDDAMIESILCATGIKSAVDPEVFKKVFDAWRMHQVVRLTYHKPNEMESTRCFEPHILVYLYDLKFCGCRSCMACKLKKEPRPNRCVLHDDLSPVLDRLHEADVVVLGSPIYFSEVTGEMRSFIERFLFQYLNYDDHTKPLSPAKKTALVFTMNCPETMFDQIGYGEIFRRYENWMNFYFGHCETLLATDTMQVKDYNRYHLGTWDGEAKRQRHETVFPQDCKKAFELGVKLASKRIL